MKRIIILVIITVVFSGAACTRESNEAKAPTGTAAISTSQPAVNQKIVLQINDQSFTNEDFRKFFEFRYPDISRDSASETLLSRIFDLFVEHRLIVFKATAENLTIEENERDEFLQKMQVNKENVDTVLLDDMIKAQKYLYFNAYNDISVANSEIEQYYNTHLEEFQRSEEVELYQILVKDREKAIEIRGLLINAPARFEEIARKESVSPEAKNDGLMGNFEKGTLPNEMEDVVFSLKLNEISPIVESPYGFHIFKVKRKKKKRQIYFDASKEEIKEKLLSGKLRLAYRDLLDSIKKEVQINILNQNLGFKYSGEKGDIYNETDINQNISSNYFNNAVFQH